MKIAIASGKGGTGKTTLSTNLISYIAEYYKSDFDNIVLIDLDVEEPNSGLFLSGKTIKQEIKYRKVPKWDKNRCTLCGECADVCNFNAIAFLKNKVMVFPELCHSCYACSELCPENALPMFDDKMGVLTHKKISSKTYKFDFIEGKLDIGQESAIPLITQTIEYVDEKFGENTLKIYDAPPGTSCPMIEAIKNADFVILITEPTPFGVHDVKLAVETARILHKKLGIVINKYGIGNNEIEKYCEKEKIQILAKIPNSRKIAELYSEGKLLYNEIPVILNELEKIYILTIKK